MRLIAMLISLWLNRYPDALEPWRGDGLLQRYFAYVYGGVGARNAVLTLTLLLLPPLVVLGALQYVLAERILGLGELVLGVWALVFAHGPGRVDDQLDAFISAWRQGEGPRARMLAAELSEESTADVPAPLAALQGLFWQTEQRLLGPLFWFLLLGPVGAVAYRLVRMALAFISEHQAVELRPGLDALGYALGWLPARASALAFALAGSFVHALEGWARAREGAEGNKAVVVQAGEGALNTTLDERSPDVVEKVLSDARGMITRSIFIWLAAAAVLTIAGQLR